jgi:hypothetical protein
MTGSISELNFQSDRLKPAPELSGNENADTGRGRRGRGAAMRELYGWELSGAGGELEEQVVKVVRGSPTRQGQAMLACQGNAHRPTSCRGSAEALAFCAIGVGKMRSTRCRQPPAVGQGRQQWSREGRSGLTGPQTAPEWLEHRLEFGFRTLYKVPQTLCSARGS